MDKKELWKAVKTAISQNDLDTARETVEKIADMCSSQTEKARVHARYADLLIESDTGPQ